MFTPDEIAAHLAQIERAQVEEDVEGVDEDDPFGGSSCSGHGTRAAVRLIKELLTATTLGTSQLRRKNGRRHQVDFEDAPVRVEVYASEQTIEILVGRHRNYTRGASAIRPT